jgi:catechol 2,3-dioxygenase-like lactoylglutathione lyase family enzyme
MLDRLDGPFPEETTHVPMINRPHHMGIQVADLERSVSFYRDILGFEVVFQWNPQAEYIRTITGYPEADIHAAVLRLPGESGVFLEILEYRNVDKTPVDTRTANPGTAHLAFFTDDCDGLYAELVAKGVKSVSPPVTPTMGPNTGGRAVYMIDPDGIRVEFITTSQTFDGKPNH